MILPKGLKGLSNYQATLNIVCKSNPGKGAIHQDQSIKNSSPTFIRPASVFTYHFQEHSTSSSPIVVNPKVTKLLIG